MGQWWRSRGFRWIIACALWPVALALLRVALFSRPEQTVFFPMFSESIVLIVGWLLAAVESNEAVPKVEQLPVDGIQRYERFKAAIFSGWPLVVSSALGVVLASVVQNSALNGLSTQWVSLNYFIGGITKPLEAVTLMAWVCGILILSNSPLYAWLLLLAVVIPPLWLYFVPLDVLQVDSPSSMDLWHLQLEIGWFVSFFAMSGLLFFVSTQRGRSVLLARTMWAILVLPCAIDLVGAVLLPKDIYLTVSNLLGACLWGAAIYSPLNFDWWDGIYETVASARAFLTLIAVCFSLLPAIWIALWFRYEDRRQDRVLEPTKAVS